MSMTPVRAAVFDLGNTLWFQARMPDYERVFGLQAAAVAPQVASYGMRVDSGVFAEIWQAYDDAGRTSMRAGRSASPACRT